MQAEIAEQTSSLGGFGYYEVVSFSYQVEEADKYLADKSADTPFINALLAARNFEGETKDSLVAKIKEKASNWAVYYAGQLGKYHRKVKELEDATTLDAIIAVSW
jgi:uncharacterized protein YtpQ (UPF0354 family)